jgi:SAM-dependent methyltransferase
MPTTPRRRLHLGAADPLAYAPEARAFLGTPAWIHLYSPVKESGSGPPAWRRLARRLLRRGGSPAAASGARPGAWPAELLRGWTYLAFWMDERSHLPFQDGRFGFALSEHLLEHLFLPEAFHVIREVRRVLAPGGVFRVSVPDADLRPDPIEPLAFDASSGRTSRSAGRWDDPAVHKTRWNVYSLGLMLRLGGFEVATLRAYDRAGARTDRRPARGEPPYGESADWEAIGRFDYLRRPDSLIVDAVAVARPFA